MTALPGVKVHEPQIGAGRASIVVDVAGPGRPFGHLYVHPVAGQAPVGRRVDLRQDRRRGPGERVFCLSLRRPRRRRSSGTSMGCPASPTSSSCPGACGVGTPCRAGSEWTARTTASSWCLSTLPLVHLGGVNTGRVVEHLDPGTPVIMSWALNNHWFVNFKAQQDGQIRLRYSLSSMAGHLDVDDAMRFAAEARTPPVVLRDRVPIASAERLGPKGAGGRRHSRRARRSPRTGRASSCGC